MAVLALETAALARDPSPTEIALARRLFAEAQTAEDSKDWPAAAAKLRDAISIKETSGLRFHLAYCEEQQGLLVEALVDYERADDISVEKDEDLRSQIPARRTSLQRRIPTVTLLFPRDPSSASLTVDRRSLGSTSFGKPMPLNPGKHAFAVSSPGFFTFTTELSLNEGDAVVTNVVLVPDSNANSVSVLADSTSTSAPGPRGRSGASPARTILLVGEAAATAGALAIGIAFTLEASSEDETASRARARLPGASACTPSAPSQALPSACAELAGAVDDARRDRFAARLGFIGAGVGAAAFAATLFLWPSRRPQAAIHPWIAPDARGLSLATHF
jgi:hypothetical protein